MEVVKVLRAGLEVYSPRAVESDSIFDDGIVRVKG